MLTFITVGGNFFEKQTYAWIVALHNKSPIIFVPEVNLVEPEDDSIIDSFWTACAFFLPEEHARAYRRKNHRIRGADMKADQMIEMTRIIQSVIFTFRE